MLAFLPLSPRLECPLHQGRALLIFLTTELSILSIVPSMEWCFTNTSGRETDRWGKTDRRQCIRLLELLEQWATNLVAYTTRLDVLEAGSLR